jgi:hypothetical protein
MSRSVTPARLGDEREISEADPLADQPVSIAEL